MIRKIWNAHRTMPPGLKFAYNGTLLGSVLGAFFGLILLVPGGEVSFAGEPITGSRVPYMIPFLLFGLYGLSVCNAVATGKSWAKTGLLISSLILGFIFGGALGWIAGAISSLLILYYFGGYLFGSPIVDEYLALARKE